MGAKTTPGPWGWQKMGEWMLVGQHGMRPIVLSTRAHGPMKERGFTSLDHERGLLVPFDPSHADAKLIAAAPALADALETFVSDADVSLESLERVAEEFRRETGFLAPGKDEAAAVNSGVTVEQRRAAWNEWSGKRIRARLEAARAALKLAGRLP